MAAFAEKVLRMRLLEVAGADFGRGDMRGDRQHRYARAMAVEEPVDEVQVAGSTAPGADRQAPGQLRLGARRERRDLLVADMDPCDFALPADCVRQAVQAVADDPVDPLDACRRERCGELVCNCPHLSAPWFEILSSPAASTGRTSAAVPGRSEMALDTKASRRTTTKGQREATLIGVLNPA